MIMAEEKNFEKKVKIFLKSQGCWILKTWSNGIQREGIPDLLVCCNGYFLGVELKAENGKPRPLQLFEIREIREAKGIGIVLYPEQFEDFKQLIKLLVNNKYDLACKFQYQFRGTERNEE